MSSDNDNGYPATAGSPATAGEIIIDLTEKKYVGFIIPANPTAEMPLCSIMSRNEMFPFRAIPIEKKLRFPEVKKLIKCEIGEFIDLTRQLKRLGIQSVIADEEGMCKIRPQPNVDASALCERMGLYPLVGDVAFLKYRIP